MQNREGSSNLPRSIQIWTAIAWFVLPAIVIAAGATSSATATVWSALDALTILAIIEAVWIAVFAGISHATRAQESVHRAAVVCFAFTLAMLGTLFIVSIGILCVLTNASTCV